MSTTPDPISVGFWETEEPVVADTWVYPGFLAKMSKLIELTYDDEAYERTAGVRFEKKLSDRCRLCCKKHNLGLRKLTLTTGSTSYVFPASLYHYYVYHNVQPPAAFLKFILDFDLTSKETPEPDRKIMPPRESFGVPWFPSVFATVEDEDSTMAKHCVFKLDGVTPSKSQTEVDILRDLQSSNGSREFKSTLFRPSEQSGPPETTGKLRRPNLASAVGKRSDFIFMMSGKVTK